MPSAIFSLLSLEPVSVCRCEYRVKVTCSRTYTPGLHCISGRDVCMSVFEYVEESRPDVPSWQTARRQRKRQLEWPRLTGFF